MPQSKDAVSLGFRAPMLATAVTSLPYGTWVWERKYDGIRLIVSRQQSGSYAFSRLGNAWWQKLPAKLQRAIEMLPLGIYDGELYIPGGYSSDVADLSNREKLKLVLFDRLQEGGIDITSRPWSVRRASLERAMQMGSCIDLVELAPYEKVKDWAHAQAIAETVWAEDGEGLILKDTNATYRVGKRTKVFIKLKQVLPGVLTVVGFAPSEGMINDRGSHGTVVLLDDEGNYTVVKTLNDKELARLDREALGPATHVWKVFVLPGGTKVRAQVNHPRVGSKLHIEYQFRTPDGSYRHPRWDRWDSE